MFVLGKLLLGVRCSVFFVCCSLGVVSCFLYVRWFVVRCSLCLVRRLLFVVVRCSLSVVRVCCLLFVVVCSVLKRDRCLLGVVWCFCFLSVGRCWL